ncbi:uncharacterized protein PGTG_11626 [Puccinia graminis f. sp. tritici CRL 75-36-700-3]|uniref:Uncharacterized protein n=1 Tax=Puccinia graminis f. sp. tritici (strain CRL 75-36-700-3 / race SCCL) TaxID=418459 RepID=E3KNJ5_PUCGT|nr:uncharacterized protein PGTG_11626 [Puccinia graminis f. sp. tritici CRL 75-36-700-3]EFP85870.2 hypothetical protein PGTG_11626 [Puccinia graminis f. sp. tritici CRL 75-36-700-3]
MSLTSYIPAYKNLREMESIINDLTSTLREEANAYDSEKLRGFSASSESSLLQSAQKLGPLRVELAKNLRRGLFIYCIDTCLLVVVGQTLAQFQGLYEGSAPPENVEAAPSLIKRLKKNPLRRKLNRDRRRLVCHALCVYASTALHLPPLIILGLNDPLAVLANVILLILNINSRQLIRARMEASRLNPQPPARSPDPNTEQRKAISNSLNDRSSQRCSPPPPDIHIALNNLEENVPYNEKTASWCTCAAPGDLDRKSPLVISDPHANETDC